MGNIVKYIRSMPPQQINVARNFLKNKQGKEDPQILELKLFERILSCSENELKDETLSKFIYGKQGKTCYRKLKSRLHEKMLDAFCNDNHINDHSIFRSESRMNLKLKKKMLQCYVLERTPNKERLTILESELDSVVELAKKAESYDVMHEALVMKRRSLGAILSREKLHKLQEQIDQYQKYCDLLTEANGYYFSAQRIKVSTSDTERRKAIEFYEKAIPEMNLIDQRITSYRLKFFLLEMERNYAEILKDHVMAFDKSTAIIALISEHDHLFPELVSGRTYHLLCRYAILLGMYEEAADNALDAQKQYKEYESGYRASKFYEFYAAFYGANYIRAEKNAKELIELSTDQDSIGQYNYFLASVLFKQGAVREAFKIANNIRSCPIDKCEWSLGLKYLLIMIHVEMGDTYSASSAVEALRKLFERLPVNSPVSARDRIIVKCFWEMEKQSFEIQSDKEKIKHYLNEVQMLEKKNGKLLFSHELIQLDEWIASRMISSEKVLVEVRR